MSPRVATRSMPCRTTVYSSNAGVRPGSLQPAGLVIRATLTAAVPLFTRPKNSSITLGLFPAASITAGRAMSWNMAAGPLPRPSLDRRADGREEGALLHMDVFAQHGGLELDLLEPVLDHIADAD